MDWVYHSLPRETNIESITALKGSTSTTLYHIKTDRKAYVLRLYDNKDWLSEEPDLAAHEAASLRQAAHLSSPLIHTPEVVNVDETGESTGMPTVLMTHIQGDIDLSPNHFNEWLKELAGALFAIHQIPLPPNGFKWAFHRYNKPEDLHVPAWTKQPELWEKAIEFVRQPSPSYQDCYIHRDYHPVNVLWEDEKIVGIVDWANACRGPAGIDLGHCRNNLVALFGIEAAGTFLNHYQRLAGNAFQYHPYWDLVAFLDFTFPGPPDVYQGWTDFGINHLNGRLIADRLEKYLMSLVACI
ncbi:aminoglycoside phosphotransferase family protein [Camelliibacillus cellulosilyticus]|uniref:Aminoglycoside phosphotransferase family protein n=1 Tax=Camelliibacillus cellulosilyticus TaxID=2174486 RepID=A0ABV9GK25_9BACL